MGAPATALQPRPKSRQVLALAQPGTCAVAQSASRHHSTDTAKPDARAMFCHVGCVCLVGDAPSFNSSMVRRMVWRSSVASNTNDFMPVLVTLTRRPGALVSRKNACAFVSLRQVRLLVLSIQLFGTRQRSLYALNSKLSILNKS